jgi:ketosteroid isomerase-like protein
VSTEANLEVVRRLWAAYEAEGMTAITEFAHPDAEWHPHSAGGRRFLSTQEYRDYIRAAIDDDVRVESTLQGTWAYEDVVASRGRIRIVRGGTPVDDTRIYWVHRFRDGLMEWTASSPDLGALLERAGYPDDRLAAEAAVALSRRS